MTMPSFWSLLHTPTVELLGWTLLHFVWQGALMAAVLAGALVLLRDHSPRVRYAVGCAALIGLLALPIGTGVVLSESLVSSAPVSSSSMAVVDDAARIAEASRVGKSTAATAPSWREWAASAVQPVLPWIVLAWGLGVIVFAVRLGGGAWHVRRLRRRSSAAPSEWRDRLQSLAERMDVAASVLLRRSDRVEGPVLAGWWRPVILVPAGFLSGLPPKQVEALLLHELAHVRRHDVLVGRLQAIVETLFFFHPATWWISRQVRQAREACCDDLVVEAGSGRTTYAQALTVLAERTVESTATTTWVPAASDGSLLDRIQRLVVPPEAPSAAGRRLSIVAAALLMVIVPVGLAACASQQSTTTTDSASAPIQAERESERPREEEVPGRPKTPPAPDKQSAVVVIQDDSTERTIRLGPDESVEGDRLEKDMYVFRSGSHVDTVHVPGLTEVNDPPHPPFAPDSLGRALRMRLDPDSLERAVKARVNPDSLERVILARINPDSIERVVRMRFDRDSLEQHIYRLERRADSIARRFTERFSDEWADRWREVPDSAVAFRFEGFDPDNFDREDFGVDLNVDSLIHRHEHRADSLRQHFEQFRERMQKNRSETLREQAHRLREQAERLEEQAEEMEKRPEEVENGSPE